MTKEQTKQNPFTLEYGCMDRHEMCINGYGITLDSIKYWLFENNLNTKPIKMKNWENKLGNINLNDIDFEDLNYITGTVSNNQIDFVTGTNTEMEAFMCWDIPHSETRQTSISTIEIKKYLIDVINNLFEIPKEKQESLKQFINKYTDIIEISDFS